jgi:hypothetical protein
MLIGHRQRPGAVAAGAGGHIFLAASGGLGQHQGNGEAEHGHQALALTRLAAVTPVGRGQ